jgi:site-specific DNA-cytosine methylase
MRAINLFTGVGGPIDGLTLAGDNVLWALESDEDAASVVRANFPSVQVRSTGLNSILAKDIPHAELVFIGTPLTKDYDGASTMTQSIISIVSPRVIVMDWKISLFTNSCMAWLLKLGYKEDSYPEGEFIVFFRKDVKIGTYLFPFPELDDRDPKYLSDILESNPNEALCLPREKADEILARDHDLRQNTGMSLIYTPSSNYRPLNLRFHKNPYSFVVDAGQGLRLLSPLECARIMGLRDSFVPDCSRTKAYKLLTHTRAPAHVRLLSEELKVWI